MFLAIICFVLLSRAFVVLGLQVSPGSACATLCLDNPESDPLDPASSTTTASDITCNDDEYDSTGKGIKFKNCLECLQESNEVNGTENDVSWFLYNVRYAVDVCVYGFPNATKSVSSPCDIDYACQPLKSALEIGGLNPENATEFDYCDADNGKFSGAQVEACIQCFDSSSSQAFMANFITTLKAGCQQRPEPGQLLGLSGSPFSASLVNITNPPSNETQSSDSADGTGMTTGAVVGIAVGASLLFLGGTALFWVYYRKQKRLYSDYDDAQYDRRTGSKSISPPLGGSLYSAKTNNYSHLGDYELRDEHSYKSNAAYYDTMEKRPQPRPQQHTFDANRAVLGTTGALPTHPAYINGRTSRNSSRGPSPQPPRPVKSNKPDSYALAAYLNAADEAIRLPGPPLGPPPSVYGRTMPNDTHRGSQLSTSFRYNANGPSVQDITQSTAIQPPSVPPPPPRQAKIPSISLPSVPRIRIPKKYTPPQIHVQEATPVVEQGEVLPIGIEISRPIVEHNKRFVDSSFQGRRDIEHSQPPPKIIEQTVLDRRPNFFVQDLAMQTGKTTMYG